MDGVRGEIPQTSALERASRAMDVADRREERETEVRRAERADEREGMAMAEAAAERMQLAVRGWTDRELATQQALAEAQRQERIGELEAELDRLDPQRRAARRVESQRMAMEATLGRARTVDADGYMARAVADYDRRQQIQRQRVTAAEIAHHEQELIRMGRY